MVFTALYPALAFYLVLIASLLGPATAQPYSRFSQASQYIHPTFHLLPLSWRQAKRLARQATHLQRRGLPGAVYICTQETFRGNCAWIMPDNKCHIPGTGNKSPQSVGPDPGGFCILWEKATCTGNQIQTLRFPGLDSAVPDFGGINCYANSGNAMVNATSSVQNGGWAGSGILAPQQKGADPRLPGGVGSLDAKKLKEVLEEMEKDGFREGMIGMKKGHYY